MSTIKTDNENLVLHADGAKDVEIQTNGSTKLTVKSSGALDLQSNLGDATTLANSKTARGFSLNSKTTGSNSLDMFETGEGDYGLQVSNSAGTTAYGININPFGGNVSLGGIVTTPYQPAFRMVLSNNNNDMATGTSNISGWAYNEVIPKMAKEFDIGNNVTSMTDATGGQSYVKFTAPVTGVYHFCLNGGVRNLSSGDWTSIGLLKNAIDANVEEHYMLWHSLGTAVDSSSGSGVNIQLAANDYVVLSSQSVESTNLENKFGFSGHLIG